VSRRLAFGAEGSWWRSVIGDLDQPVDGVDAAGTVAFDATRTLSVSGALGVSRVTDVDRAAKTGPAWRVTAVQKLPRATLTASYAKSFVPAFGLGGSVQNEELSASLLMPVARNRLYLQAGVSYRRNEPLLSEELRLNSLWMHSAIGYGLHRLVRVEVFFARSQQDSLRPGGQVHRNRLGVQLVTAKPMRIK
jgi:hypothetical protein